MRPKRPSLDLDPGRGYSDFSHIGSEEEPSIPQSVGVATGDHGSGDTTGRTEWRSHPAARPERRTEMSASELRTRPDAASMLPVNGERPARPSTTSLEEADRERLLRYMLMMRLSEERALSLYKQGKVPGSFYDGCGQEAIGVGAAYALAPEDRLCILHRDLGAHFVRGVDAGALPRQLHGPLRRRHRRPRRQHALRRSRPRLRRHGLDAARHGARRQRHGDGVQAASTSRGWR